MTLYQRIRLKQGLLWKSQHPPMGYALRIAVMIIIALIFALMYARRDAQHLSNTTALLLNGGTVLVDNRAMTCKLTAPMLLVSGL